MRDIRARIAQRQGVELTNQQIEDLAARRLESILDPRAIKPSLLEGLRRSAGAVAPPIAAKASSEPVYSFEDTTIYDSPRAIVRLIRRLLNPFLKLFFNPNPLIRALHLQARLNVEAAERDAERDRRQAEWNALHYEIVQRVVTDVARVSLEVQALSMRVESLNARVDFNDRRVRTLEGGAYLVRAAARPPEAGSPQPPEETPMAQETAEIPGGEGGRRRRRRRRGRRSGSPLGEPHTTVSAPAASPMSSADELLDTAAPDESAPSDHGFTAVTLEAADMELPPDTEPREDPPATASWDEPPASSTATLGDSAAAEPAAAERTDESGNSGSDQ